jgi:demethylmenaquinone methyltransferase / 2-methoxy-6-polyprenyl-1,4-benzoquinol methylase
LRVGDSVLDVCGGTGDLSVLAVKEVGSSGKVILADINRNMIEAGKRKQTHAAERRKISYLQSDAEQMGIKSDSVDVAMVGFGIRNLTHMEEGFREMHRVLKPGGKLMCLEFSSPTWGWFRWLYDFYSFNIMPYVGLLFTGSTQPFTYLPESIRLFHSPEGLAALLTKLGFRNISYRRLTNGIATVHVGLKPFEAESGY